MANYNKSTNFTAKDSLPTGNSGKIVKGTEIDIELTAVSNAIASKADINSPNLTGTPTAPTAGAGTATTQLATTAFVTAALSAAYPVGSIYINASSSTNPSALLGFGTWEAFGAGRVMVGLNASDALFDTLEETGGSKDAVVVSHTHTATVTSDAQKWEGTNSVDDQFDTNDTSAARRRVGFQDATTTVVNSSTGVSGTNANVQPYITVRMWKRTA